MWQSISSFFRRSPSPYDRVTRDPGFAPGGSPYSAAYPYTPASPAPNLSGVQLPHAADYIRSDPMGATPYMTAPQLASPSGEYFPGLIQYPAQGADPYAPSPAVALRGYAPVHHHARSAIDPYGAPTMHQPRSVSPFGRNAPPEPVIPEGVVMEHLDRVHEYYAGRLCELENALEYSTGRRSPVVHRQENTSPYRGVQDRRSPIDSRYQAVYPPPSGPQQYYGGSPTRSSLRSTSPQSPNGMYVRGDPYGAYQWSPQRGAAQQPYQSNAAYGPPSPQRQW